MVNINRLAVLLLPTMIMTTTTVNTEPIDIIELCNDDLPPHFTKKFEGLFYKTVKSKGILVRNDD